MIISSCIEVIIFVLRPSFMSLSLTRNREKCRFQVKSVTSYGGMYVIHALSVRLSISLTKKLSLDKNVQEWLQYKTECTLGKIITFVPIIFISILFNCFWPSLIFLIYFLTLRRFTGGYHANSQWFCSVLSIVICLGSAFFAKYVSERYVFLILLLFSIISFILVFIYAPVNHPNLKLNSYEIRSLKWLSKLVLSIEVASLYILFALHVNQLLVLSGSAAILAVSLTILFAKIIRQEEACSEQKV